MTRRDFLVLQYLIENRTEICRDTGSIRRAVFQGSGRCERRLSMLKKLGYVTSEARGRGVGKFGGYRPAPHVWDITLEGVNAYRAHEGEKPLGEDWEDHYTMPGDDWITPDRYR